MIVAQQMKQTVDDEVAQVIVEGQPVGGGFAGLAALIGLAFTVKKLRA